MIPQIIVLTAGYGKSLVIRAPRSLTYPVQLAE